MSSDLEKIASSQAVTAFLEQTQALEPLQHKGRLIFALDATASRQPTWDTAMHTQAALFSSADSLAGLSVQLLFFHGLARCLASKWQHNSSGLLEAMQKVQCRAGQTQIQRVLRHAINEHKQQAVQALVYIGDSVEESPDTLLQLAGQCGMLGLKIFVFQEGQDPYARDILQGIAHASGGAWEQFDHHSPAKLQALLGAVSSYATGGSAAVARLSHPAAKALLAQIQ